jgi:cysteine desulfurase/selenocysteine lyase
MDLDIQKIRTYFPALDQKVHGKDLVYLDNGATSLKPQQVIDRLVDYYAKENANVHRGVHFLSQEATTAMENTREHVRDFLNAASIEEIIFTKGTTESINLLAFSFAERYLNEGDEIIVTEMEHHANFVPWKLACDRKKAKLKVVPIFYNGELDIEVLKKLLNSRTRLLAINHVSNALGTVNPVEEIIQLAHEQGVVVHVDGAQSVPHLQVDVRQLGCDFYTFSGHKMYAPMGIGVMYGKQNYLEEMPPYQSGGEMIDQVSAEEVTFNTLPFKFEAGTPNVGGILGLDVAISFMNEIGIEQIATHEDALLHYAEEELAKIPEVQIMGNPAQRAGVLSMTLKGIHHYDAATILDQLGIAVRSGHHCAQPVMRRYGVEGSLRISFAVYNTKEEIDTFVHALKRVISMFT